MLACSALGGARRPLALLSESKLMKCALVGLTEAKIGLNKISLERGDQRVAGATGLP